MMKTQIDVNDHRKVLGRLRDAHDPEPTFPAAAVRRMMAAFAVELSEAEMAHEAQTWAEAVEETRARGTLQLDFPGADGAGSLHYRDLVTGEEASVPAVGQLTVHDLIEVNELVLAHPSADLVANLPLDQIGYVRILGCHPDLTAALATHTGLRRLSLVAVITDDDERVQADGFVPSPGGQPITDADLAHLGRLVDLVELDIDGLAASDGAVAQLLPQLTQLRHLTLIGDSLTGRCLAGLAGRETDLVFLDGPQVSGESLSHLPTLAGVNGAVFQGPRVCEGLDPAALLAAMPDLSWLELHHDAQTPVAPAVTSQFTALRPDLEVNTGDQAYQGCGATCGIPPSQSVEIS